MVMDIATADLELPTATRRDALDPPPAVLAMLRARTSRAKLAHDYASRRAEEAKAAATQAYSLYADLRDVLTEVERLLGCEVTA